MIWSGVAAFLLSKASMMPRVESSLMATPRLPLSSILSRILLTLHRTANRQPKKDTLIVEKKPANNPRKAVAARIKGIVVQDSGSTRRPTDNKKKVRAILPHGQNLAQTEKKWGIPSDDCVRTLTLLNAQSQQPDQCIRCGAERPIAKDNEANTAYRWWLSAALAREKK